MQKEQLQIKTKTRTKTMQKNYKLTIAYDGTRYKGWQSQKATDATIQGKLNHVFSELEGKPTEVQGSGRTDAGVHALGQVANVYLETEKTIPEIMDYANRYLPEDIGITAMEEAPKKFHARLFAVKKTYCYRIHNSPLPNVFERKWMHQIKEPLDVPAMQAAAPYFEGIHDFAAFCRHRQKKKTTVRTIHQLTVTQQGSEIDITITGNGFLHNMVRIIAGTLVEIGQGARQPQDIPALLESGIRAESGITMPAKGLILKNVEY